MNCLIFLIAGFAAFLIALTVHEYCHALTAYFQGDETASRAGRLTLNPLAHIDPVGTILIPLLGMFSGLPVFGWAKPVPFNPYNIRNGKWGSVAIAMAGPGSNFLMAVLSLAALRLLLGPLNLPLTNLLVIFLTQLAMVNVFLGLFNFIPLPPLDGSKLLQSILDAPKYRRFLINLEMRGPMILLTVLFLDYLLPFSIISRFFFGALHGLFSLAGLRGLLGLLMIC